MSPGARRLRDVARSGAVALALFAATPAPGQEPVRAPGQLWLRGQVSHPRSFSLADLQAMTPTHVEVSAVTDQDPSPKSAAYDGVLLWSLIDGAGLIDAPGRKTRPLHVFLASGADGYAVAVAIGEISPKYEGKQVLVAYRKNGKPLPGLELVVPGDRHAARFVKTLLAIDVK
jgi:hypothetical protein